MNPKLREAFKFHRENGSYCTPPGRAQCALDAARAELAAHLQGWDIIFEPDWSLGCSHSEFFCEEAYPKGEPQTCETALLIKWEPDSPTDKVLASLGCIDDADENYRRVIFAELAQEALENN